MGDKHKTFGEAISELGFNAAGELLGQPEEEQALFCKVMFSSTEKGTTAGLVVNTAQHNVRDVVAISRLFPATEAPKMRVYHCSPAFRTAEEAFAHVFDLRGGTFVCVVKDAWEKEHR